MTRSADLVVEGGRPARLAPRRAPRPRLPRRPLQRQQRARRRLRDAASSRRELAASSVNLVQQHRDRRRLPLRVQPRRRRRPGRRRSPLDWAQAFAQKGAVLVGGTGYQYGDTDFLEYSERLYRDFAARASRRDRPARAISIGEALAAAKRTYITGTPDIRGIHEKAVLEATLFGLPMFGVDSAAQRRTGPAPAAVRGASRRRSIVRRTSRRARPRHRTTSRFVTPTTSRRQPGARRRRARPASPVPSPRRGSKGPTASSRTRPSRRSRRRSSTSPRRVDDSSCAAWASAAARTSMTSNVLPLTGAPTTELRGVHAPFVSPVFYPMRMWTSNYFGEFDIGRDEPDRHAGPASSRSGQRPAQTIRRVFTDLDLRLFYADAPTLLDGANADAALADAPTIVDVDATPDGSDIVFSAHVVGDPTAADPRGLGRLDRRRAARGRRSTSSSAPAPLPASCAGLDDSRVWTGRLPDAPVASSTSCRPRTASGS